MNGTQDVYWLDHRDVLMGTQEMSFLEPRKYRECTTGFVMPGTQEMLRLEHRKHLVWNTSEPKSLVKSSFKGMSGDANTQNYPHRISPWHYAMRKYLSRI